MSSTVATAIRRPSPREILPDALTIGDIAIRVVDQPHGAITIAGLRFDCGGKSIGICH